MISHKSTDGHKWGASAAASAPRLDPESVTVGGLEVCFAHTDLAWRLTQIPDHYAVRGVFMNMLDERAEEFGPDVQAAYRRFFGTFQFAGIRLYPVKDYLTRLVKLAAIRFGGPGIHQGLFEIQAAAFPAWRRSLPGRMTFAVLGSNLDAILKVTNRAMSGAINHGTCQIAKLGPDRYVASFRDQPNYVEHSMAGALAGVARACGLDVAVETEMLDAFNGDVRLTVRGTLQRGVGE
jgi:uncharacterized protein (TIGR02265 family)